MEAQVDLLEAQEVPRAARLLARAFAADPVIGYYLAGKRRGRLAFPAFFRAALYDSMPHGAVFAAWSEGALVGVAAWVPPEPTEVGSTGRARRSTLALRALFPRSAGRLLAGFANLSSLHPTEPHWYLAFVGIDPALQGKGLGARLLAPVLERADEAGVLCYLETPFPETRAFYRRLGFEVTSELRAFEAPAPVWTMTRPPATDRTAGAALWDVPSEVESGGPNARDGPDFSEPWGGPARSTRWTP